MNKEITVYANCPSCRNTGLYQGFMEQKDEAVVCIHCDGTGRMAISYRPFTGRKGRMGIKRIRYGTGLILDNPSKSSWMTYADFKKNIPAPKVKK